ncbi:hydrogenase-4 component B [Atlantibacter hermannii]|nr:hydrogenase-4 component B [Atlantibacter hermannii]
MMDSLQLLLWAIVFYVAGGCASLLLRHAERIAIYAAGVSAMIGGILGIAAAWPVVMGGDAVVFATQGLFPFAAFSVRLDGLAAFMVLVISLLVVVCSLYSLSYVQEYRGRGAWGMGFFMNLFIASMVGLVVMDNAFYFIILFEMMSLASWFLVIAEQDDESVSAGLLYFFIAHAGSVLIMMAFFLLWRESGSLDFASFRTLQLSPGTASVVFLLAFLGFGAKAGMLPLHSWLPRAHPAAPSHASALMSGVMVKIGIFGIIKVGIDFTRHSTVVGDCGAGVRCGFGGAGRAVCAGRARHQTPAGLAHRGKHRDYFDGCRRRHGGDCHRPSGAGDARHSWRALPPGEPCGV